MDRKYVKCVLDKGFAIVREKENIADGWFPNITFFGTDGNFLFTLLGDSKKKFYDALTKLGDPEANQEDRQEFDYSTLSKSYTFEWKLGWLCVFETNVVKDKTKDSLVIIDKTSAKKILEGIKNLV
ncbi:MAG: hypothetical protein WA052_01915 [Microgenomates group bacterium]